MRSEEALLRLRDFIESCGDEKVRHSFYLEFNRRLLVLQLVEKYCPPGGVIADLGAQPFIISGALSLMGYEVVAYDYEPKAYVNIAKAFGVKVVKCDLERDSLGMQDGSVDCVVLSEVIEHINPYYVNRVLAEVNRVLKPVGKLIVMTPNIASLFRRAKLLLGRQPQYRLHVHEYTKGELESLLLLNGFRLVESFYSDVCDLAFVDAPRKEDYLELRNYRKLLKVALRKATKTNILRALAYPIVKVAPSLRMLIVVVAEKESDARFRGVRPVERW